MKMKKNNKLASPTPAQDSENNTPISLICQIDEENGIEDEKSQNHADIEQIGKKPKICSPSNDNAAPDNQQQPQVVAVASVPGGVFPPDAARPCRPQVQLNPGLHQVQQLQVPPGFMPANLPGFGPGYQPIPQVSAGGPAGGPVQVTATGNAGQIPGVYYQYGIPYPAYPSGRPWDPSSWWTQMQQSPPPGIFPIPGACNYFPMPTPQQTAVSSGASLQSYQKGVIRPSAELSKEHQVLWEAQSAENVQLWAVIASLQSELVDVRNHLAKLETEAQSVKPAGQQPDTPSTGRGLPKQTTKRGRPRKCGPLVSALPCTNEHHPRSRGRKPRINGGPLEIRGIHLRKDIQDQLESTERFSPLISVQHGNRGSVTNSADAACQRSRLHNPMQSIQTSGIGLSSASENKDVANVSLETFKQVNVRGGSVPFKGSPGSISHGFLSNNHSDSGAEITRENPQGLHTHDNLGRHENGEATPWSLVNEEEHGSEDLDEETTESDKLQDEEMENAVSIGTEAISRAKNDKMEPYNGDTLQDDDNPFGFLTGNPF